ncbi:hypothetical protein ACFPFV_08070 [Salinicoccus siamensis]|uniref:Uncharacterized protein n=1 Tax=Salinicoccus siamensis TaxID=381830 RepID=A0ABV5Z396_9STAP
MISFQKEDVEIKALKLLKEYDSKKYKDAYKSEMPDIQNDITNVGVEVVVVDFKENLFLDKLFGAPFLQFLKMTNCYKIKKKELEGLLEVTDNDVALQEIINSKPVYDKNGKAHHVTTRDEIQDLRPKQEIYLTSYSKYQFELDEKDNIKLVVPPAQWVGPLPEMMLQAVKDKEEKAKKYKQFEELNLYLQSFISDKEEIDEFEKLINEYHKKSKCLFKNVYLPAFWTSEQKIYHISLD